MQGRGAWTIITQELRKIHERLDDIVAMISRKEQLVKVENPGRLLQLTDHQRKSYLAVCELGEATAGDVAVKTGRCRAMESNLLNRLVERGFLRRFQRGRWVVFCVAIDLTK